LRAGNQVVGAGAKRAPKGAIRSKSKSGSGLQIDRVPESATNMTLAITGADFDPDSDSDFEDRTAACAFLRPNADWRGDQNQIPEAEEWLRQQTAAADGAGAAA
jgi:hypothetical protein